MKGLQHIYKELFTKAKSDGSMILTVRLLCIGADNFLYYRKGEDCRDVGLDKSFNEISKPNMKLPSFYFYPICKDLIFYRLFFACCGKNFIFFLLLSKTCEGVLSVMTGKTTAQPIIIRALHRWVPVSVLTVFLQLNSDDEKKCNFRFL